MSASFAGPVDLDDQMNGLVSEQERITGMIYAMNKGLRDLMNPRASDIDKLYESFDG